MTVPALTSRRGQARVEFIAHKQEIHDLLEQGYNGKSIHHFFISSERMTMSYRMFCRYISEFYPKGKKQKQSRGLVPVSASVPMATGDITSGKGEETFHNNSEQPDKVLDTLA